MHKHIWAASLFLTLAALWFVNANPEETQPEPVAPKGTTEQQQLVSARASANAPDFGGRQFITVVVDIAPGWHIYANPTGNNASKGAETRLTLSCAPNGLRDQRVTYPGATRIKDPKHGDYFVYEGQAVIEAVVFRHRGDTSPIDAVLQFQVCSTTQHRCVPGKIRLRLQ